MDPQKRAILYMITCAVLWSSAGIFFKLLPWNPMAIAGLRSLISVAVYLVFMRIQEISFVINRYSIFASIFLTLVFILFITANKFTTSANAIVLQYSAPIFILMLSALIFKQKFRRGDILTVAATSIGISLFFFDKLSGGYITGNILALLAGLFFAAMFITTGRADDESRASGILMGHLFTAVAGIPFVFIYDTPINTVTIATILALGIFQLGIPYVLYWLAARNCSALACSLISAIEPLLNPVWVFIFNGEAPGLYALVGGVVVITAVVVWTIWTAKFPAASEDDTVTL